MRKDEEGGRRVARQPATHILTTPSAAFRMLRRAPIRLFRLAIDVGTERLELRVELFVAAIEMVNSSHFSLPPRGEPGKD